LTSDDELRDHVAGHDWYHTLELRPGITTPGWFDTRPVAPRLPWPDLQGRRCLDVGTFDGFWAFEMERRGAGEVVAVDIIDPQQWDWPVGSDTAVVEAINQRKRGGDGFLTAAAELGSKVQRHERSVYDLDAQALGRFDLVYLGSLLLHLRDPVGALSRVHEVLAPGGQLLLLDAVDLELSARHRRTAVARLDGVGRPWWWRPNLAALRQFVDSAGFRVTRGPSVVYMPAGAGQELPRVTPRSLLTAAGRQNALEHWRGDPHAWILASPR
jgi:tRNA (mo5U34)-methyltransferase